jgi:hypothetical protein
LKERAHTNVYSKFCRTSFWIIATTIASDRNKKLIKLVKNGAITICICAADEEELSAGPLNA